MHHIQIVTFGSVAIVFAVIGVDQTIYSHSASLDAVAAGWLILAMVDILWVLYFTSEEDSLSLYLLNSLGTGICWPGLAPVPWLWLSLEMLRLQTIQSPS